VCVTIRRMQIALFGGRFDPVHNGHIAIAKEVLKMKAADEVWFSLENQHQWRPIIASSSDRLAMLTRAIEHENHMKIDDTPIRLGGLTQTLFVMRELKKRMKKDRVIFLCGSDQLIRMPEWTHWKELEKEVQFLVVGRKGSPIEKVPSNCVILQDPTYEPLEDSATRIREKIKKEKSIRGLVPKKVEAYIHEKGLYR